MKEELSVTGESQATIHSQPTDAQSFYFFEKFKIFKENDIKIYAYILILRENIGDFKKNQPPGEDATRA